MWISASHRGLRQEHGQQHHHGVHGQNSARIAVKYTTMYLFNYYNDIELKLKSLRRQTFV